METPTFKILDKAVENQKNGIPFVLVTVVDGVEKTPGRSGFKMIVYRDGSLEGTVGGGTLERMATEKCSEIFGTRKNALLEFELTETSEGIGMVCGGIAKLYFEYFPPTRKAFIFGAGHLGRSLLPILDSIGFYCIVIDNREEYADKKRLPLAKEIHAGDYLKYIEKMQTTENDAVIIFTHGHIHDFDIINKLCQQNKKTKYIGMIGSQTKVKQALDKLKSNNHSAEIMNSIHAPIGLNIGKTTTQEIAIAIAAEILAVYNGITEIEFMKDKINASTLSQI